MISRKRPAAGVRQAGGFRFAGANRAPNATAQPDGQRTSLSLDEIALAVKGVVVGGHVECPGVGQPDGDRSLWIIPSPSAPQGIITVSKIPDDWRARRRHVLEALGIEVPAILQESSS